MAFPTTAVLTNFTGTDEEPLSDGSNYTGPIETTISQCRRVSNTVANATSGNADSQSYRSTLAAANDLESYITVSVLPASGDGVAVWARIQNPGNASTAAAYLAVYTTGTGFRLFKMTAGVTFTQLGSTVASPAMLANDKLGIEVVGTTIRCWHYTGGAWTQRISATDSSITGAGRVGFEIAAALSSAAARIDDHGGGQISVSTAVSGSSSITFAGTVTGAVMDMALVGDTAISLGGGGVIAGSSSSAVKSSLDLLGVGA